MQYKNRKHNVNQFYTQTKR